MTNAIYLRLIKKVYYKVRNVALYYISYAIAFDVYPRVALTYFWHSLSS